MKQVEETQRAQPSGPIAISEQPPSGSAAVTTPPGNSPIERRPWIVIPLAFLLALFMSVRKPVLFDCRVDPAENCYPMIPSGGAHNEMLLSPDDGGEISDAGKMLV